MTFRFGSSGAATVRVIEIGVTHLAAGCMVRGAAGTWRAERAWCRTWPGGEAEPGPALDAALRDLRAAWGEGGPVHVVMPGHQVLMKVLQVPAMAAAQRGRVLAFEARQAIPFPLEEVVWDTVILADDGRDLEVLLVAAKTDVVLALLDRVQTVGFSPVRVVPAGLALAAGWQHRGADSGPALVLGLGARSTQVLLVQGDQRHWRTLAVGGATMTRTIAERLGRTVEEAESLLQQVLGAGLELPADSPAGAAVQEAAEQFQRRLLTEIGRSLLLQQRQDPDLAPAAIWLTGGGATMPGLAEALAARLGRPTAVWSMPGVAADSPLAGRAEWWGTAEAAIRGERTINLLPPALAKAQAARDRRPRWVAAAILLVLAAGLPGVHFQRLAAAREAAAAELDRRAVPHRALLARIQADVAAVEGLQERGRELERLWQARVAWTRLLADLGERLAAVDHTWLERWQVLPPAEGREAAAPLRLRLSGRLLDRENPLSRVSQSSYERATALLQSLVESPHVTAIEGERFDAADPGLLRFDFTLVLNPAVPW